MVCLQKQGAANKLYINQNINEVIDMEDAKKISEKIDILQKEMDFIKLKLAQNIQAHPKKIVSLKGALKGLKIEGTDLKEAKKSLFKTGA